MIKAVALNLFVFIFYSLQDGISSCTDGYPGTLWRPRWPGTHRVPTSASQVPGLNWAPPCPADTTIILKCAVLVRTLDSLPHL